MKGALPCLALLLAACVATQEEPPVRQQAEAFVKQLGQTVKPGMRLQAAIAEVENQGFKCYEPSTPPIPMGHTVVCNHGSTPAWGLILQGDNEAKVTTVRYYERTASKR